MDMNELGKAVIEELAKQFPEDTITLLGVEQEDDSGRISIDFEADVTLEFPDCEWTCSESDDPEYSEPTKEDLDDQINYIDIEHGTTEKYTHGLKLYKDALDKLAPNSEFSVEIVDSNSYEIEDSEAKKWRLHDSGIGWNEFWGDWSYDSHPYWRVIGSVTVEAKKVGGYIYVTPKTV